MRNKLRLIVNNNFDKGESFFIKKELRSILNLYAKKVSSGDWKDYGLSVNKKEVTFDVYQRSSEKPVYRISKNLNPKRIAKKIKKIAHLYISLSQPKFSNFIVPLKNN